MSEPTPTIKHDLTVELDYGQFYLHTADNDPELASELLEEALGPNGIAQRNGLVVVTSPHQNNFEMRFGVEVWDDTPSDDLSDWQEAFEVHLEVGEVGVRYESPTMDWHDLAVPPGSYYARITGRGFVAHGWPGSTEPGDEWRLRLWPSSGPARASRLAAFTEYDEPSQPEDSGDAEDARSAAAQQAGARIKNDLDRAPGARRLSGPIRHGSS